MGKNHFNFDNLKLDTRPALRGWAPGAYCCRCRVCEQEYMGDKRSYECADCAYKAEEAKAQELQAYLRFNLNSEIKVKLHKKGYLRLLELHNELALRTNGAIESVDLDYFLKKADKHGYTSMQAWCFVRDFGDVMYPGAEGFFDLEVLIEKKDLI